MILVSKKGPVVRLLPLIIVCLLAITSCSRPIVSQFYVVIRPENTERFLGAITAIAKEDGLVTAEGKAVADTGNTMRVIEARGNGLTLFVQNLPLSGHENQKLCGSHGRPYPDPGQFVVFTVAGSFGFKDSALDLGERVFSKVRRLGYDVRRQPEVCGAAAHVRTQLGHVVDGYSLSPS